MYYSILEIREKVGDPEKKLKSICRDLSLRVPIGILLLNTSGFPLKILPGV